MSKDHIKCKEQLPNTNYVTHYFGTGLMILIIMSRMEGVRDFFESSTIHGLTYISTTQTFSKLFWICTDSCGFLTAGFFINNAALDWEENPIGTSIETFPISEVDFPNIIVCPPKEGFILITQNWRKSFSFLKMFQTV